MGSFLEIFTAILTVIFMIILLIGFPSAIIFRIIAPVFEKKKKQNQITEPKVTEEHKIQEKQEYKDNYQKRYLLTRNEWYEWKKLHRYAAERGLLICPKVRLLDLLEPRSRRGEKDFLSYLGKIQSKHVDFVICDDRMYVQGIIELDDNSHNTQERKERDIFVDEVLTSVGYKVIRVRAITEKTLDFIKEPSTPDGQSSPKTASMGADRS